MIRMTETTPQVESSPKVLLFERLGNWLFKTRNVVLPLLLLVLLFCFPPRPLREDVIADRWMDVAGLLLALLGQSLRAVTIGYKYIVRGGKGGKVYADGLVTSGMFAHARNPLYLGNLLILAGLIVIHNNPWVYLIGLPAVGCFYVAIVTAEEAYLRRKFGEDYVRYCRQVPRWIPRLKGFRESVKDIPFNWEEVLYTELGSTYTWVVMMLALLAYEATQETALPHRNAYLLALLVLFAIATAGWAAWRYWKKWLTAQVRLRTAQQ